MKLSEPATWDPALAFFVMLVGGTLFGLWFNTPLVPSVIVSVIGTIGFQYVLWVARRAISVE